MQGSSSRTRDQELLGRVVAGKYRLDACVGSGAMGAVYRATQLSLGKKVAIKVMRAEHTSDATYAARFKREAKAASRLEHPNSVQTFDFGDDQGLLFLAMEYLDGKNLLSVLKAEWPLPTERVVDVFSQVLAALAVAHEKGILHRDLKPENIMVCRAPNDDGRTADVVKVLDFGIAKFIDVESDANLGTDATLIADGTQTQTGTLTARGMLVGTPEYMSPELVRGEPLDERSDLYSLGVVLYLCLAGRLPYEDKSPIKVALKQVEELLRPPSLVNPHCDPRLEAICIRALEKDRNRRYASAREMRSDIRAVLGSEPMRAAFVSSPGFTGGTTAAATPFEFEERVRARKAERARQTAPTTPGGAPLYPRFAGQNAAAPGAGGGATAGSGAPMRRREPSLPFAGRDIKTAPGLLQVRRLGWAIGFLVFAIALAAVLLYR
jgi:serine/threonine-protein kinase